MGQIFPAFLRILCVALYSVSLLAQTRSVTQVYNAVTFDTRLSPGSRAVVKHQLGSNDSSTVVEVGGRPAPVLAVAGMDALGIQIPMELQPGPTTLVVRSGGVSTSPFQITLDAVAPAIIGGPVTPCPYLQSGDAALLAVGLGATDPLIPAGAAVPITPSPSTVLKPSITVAGRPAEVVRSVLQPARNLGFYEITFKVPPGLPAGLHRLELTIGGHTAGESLRVRSATTALAAGWREGRAAPGSIMSAYACEHPLASGEAVGEHRNPPTELNGTSVTVKDSAGVERQAPLLYVSPRQVNYILPSATATGTATVTISSGNGTASTATANVDIVNPELFVVRTSDGGAYPAGLLVRVRNGEQVLEPLVRTVNGRIEPVAIDLGPSSDELYLLLFGTGLRNRSSLANVKVRIGRMELSPDYAGPQSEFPGLDQVNVRLPSSLVGPDYCCFLELHLIVDGKFSDNDTGLVFKEYWKEQ